MIDFFYRGSFNPFVKVEQPPIPRSPSPNVKPDFVKPDLFRNNIPRNPLLVATRAYKLSILFGIPGLRKLALRHLGGLAFNTKEFVDYYYNHLNRELPLEAKEIRDGTMDLKEEFLAPFLKFADNHPWRNRRPEYS